MTGPTQIRISFVSHDGTATDGPSFDVPDPALAAEERAREADESQSWRQLIRSNIEVASGLLIRMIQDRNPRVRSLLKIFHEADRSKTAFRYLAAETFSDHAREAFLPIWIESGHHIRREVADDSILLDALWKLLPAYEGPAVRLYRGEPWADFVGQRHGICWSSDPEAAEVYAKGLNAMYDGGGVLVETLAPASAVISRATIEGVNGWEFEYVIDRRYLTEIRELKRFPQITAEASMPWAVLSDLQRYS